MFDLVSLIVSYLQNEWAWSALLLTNRGNTKKSRFAVSSLLLNEDDSLVFMQYYTLHIRT